jgi:hypothetical protein
MFVTAEIYFAHEPPSTRKPGLQTSFRIKENENVDLVVHLRRNLYGDECNVGMCLQKLFSQATNKTASREFPEPVRP